MVAGSNPVRPVKIKMEIDIIKHDLVPKHEKMNDKEKEEFLKKFNLSSSQLPKVKVSDKVLQTMDVSAGDIIKIFRKSSTIKESLYYRVVVDG